MNIFSTVVGGIGIFLLGMILMTDGLRTLAGDRLRRILNRFTGGTLSAIASGAAVTALVQSSSATTLMIIGFVSAGLITFRQATAVVFGANLGTTSTGWIVSLIGLKLNISLVVLPLIGIGVLIKLFSKNRYSAAGLALAGFGLVFLGIDTLQAGMKDLAGVVNPASLSGNSLQNLFMIILIGVIMTVIMQSSSAALATTLAALNSGAIVLDQAVVLVIGQNVGTTVTAALAAIGGTVAAKRTALAHTLFNIIAGLVALLMIPSFIFFISENHRFFSLDNHAVALAAFHTLFNLLGIILITPFLTQFTQFITKIIPEKDLELTKFLDITVANIPPVAVEAARRTVIETSISILSSVKILLENGPSSKIRQNFLFAEAALRKTREFTSHVPALASDTVEFKRYLAILHTMDHLDAVIDLANKDMYGAGKIYHFKEQSILQQLLGEITESVEWLQGGCDFCISAGMEAASKNIAETRLARRKELLQETAAGKIQAETASQEINTLIWVDQMGYHVWRLLVHLEECDRLEPKKLAAK